MARKFWSKKTDGRYPGKILRRDRKSNGMAQKEGRNDQQRNLVSSSHEYLLTAYDLPQKHQLLVSTELPA